MSMQAVDNVELRQFLLYESGYLAIKELKDGRLVGLIKMLFSVAIVVDINVIGYSHKYCYPEAQDAFNDYIEWSGENHPSGNWSKRKGKGKELINKNYQGDIE